MTTEATTSRDLSDRFLTACARIETLLARRYDTRFKGLGEALGHARNKGDRLANRHRRELAVLVDLRNAIAHSDYRDGLPIATPRSETVEAIEKLAMQFENPPRVDRYMTRNPLVAQAHDALAGHLREMTASKISQVPVYEDGTFQGLLTTNAIARWVGAHMDDGGDVVAEAVRVADIASLVEDHEVARFVAKTTTALEVCDMFAQEVAPTLVLVTERGLPTESLLGLLAPVDAPGILQDLALG